MDEGVNEGSRNSEALVDLYSLSSNPLTIPSLLPLVSEG